MAESATVNGTKEGTQASDKGNKSPKQRRNLPTLQVATSTSELKEAAFVAKVDESPTDFSMLPTNTAFSLAQDGSNPMVKASKSKAISLSDGKSITAGSGRCFRLYLTNK